MYETMANFWTEAVQVKVPQVTVYFWIIKVLCTTVGETFADLLNLNAGLGYDKTIAITFSILVVLLVIQFGLSFYVPFVYWASVVFIRYVPNSWYTVRCSSFAAFKHLCCGIQTCSRHVHLCNICLLNLL